MTSRMLFAPARMAMSLSNPAHQLDVPRATSIEPRTQLTECNTAVWRSTEFQRLEQVRESVNLILVQLIVSSYSAATICLP